MTFFGSMDYTVSKYGVIGLTNHLAWELADRRITVNVVCPGGVVTPLMEESTTPEYREAVTKRLIPLGRMCTAEEIGELVSFLASDRAAMITGQALAVDGGVLSGYGEDVRRDPIRFEHFGITTVEAMAAGAVPIVIGQAGQLEVVEHERSGLQWHTLEELAAQTRRVIDDQAL